MGLSPQFYSTSFIIITVLAIITGIYHLFTKPLLKKRRVDFKKTPKEDYRRKGSDPTEDLIELPCRKTSSEEADEIRKIAIAMRK
jgi:hypothetical protein